MDYRLPLIFILLCASPAWLISLDPPKCFTTRSILSRASLSYSGFRGEWPTDCHPGEQKSVIREYTGDSALIEFEIIVEHVTCNERPHRTGYSSI